VGRIGGIRLLETFTSKSMRVVRDGQGRHAEGFGLPHQGVDLIGPVEQTVLGVHVEVDELGRHAGFLIGQASSLTRWLILATPSFEVNCSDGSSPPSRGRGRG
jgi:hypothetical protein